MRHLAPCVLVLAALACRSSSPAPAPTASGSAASTASASPASASASSGSASSGSGSSAPSSSPASASSSFVALPGAASGAGFDDLTFAPSIRRVLAPAGGTGNLDLVDPDTHAVTVVRGFTATDKAYRGGHGEGTTSADEGRGLLFAIDRTARVLDVVDPKTNAITASTKLAASPDYVRWVSPTSEIWVTEPDAEQIEVFAFPPASRAPSRTATIAVKGGPESLVVDASRKMAFTHLWKGSSVAIDVAARAVRATWPNGCDGSRGIALDTAHALLFVGCAEGKAVALDIDHGGKRVGDASVGAGVDVIAYSAKLHHVYVPGAKSATMAIVDVAPNGGLTIVATVPTAAGAHCVAADDVGQAWVCDPTAGRLLVVKDSH
jgi:hypothetical protein